MEKMAKWLNYEFSSGSYPGEDYLKFQKDARADLKKKASAAGFELHQFLKNHYEFSAVLKDPETNQFVYVSISDVRFFNNEWFNHVLYRTMAHEKDWTGGTNNYCIWADLPDALSRMKS